MQRMHTPRYTSHSEGERRLISMVTASPAEAPTPQPAPEGRDKSLDKQAQKALTQLRETISESPSVAAQLFATLGDWVRKLGNEPEGTSPKVATEKAPENLEEALKQLGQKLVAAEKEFTDKKYLSIASIRGVVSLVERARELGGNDDPTKGGITDLFGEKLSKDKAGKILSYKGGGQVEVSAEKVDLECTCRFGRLWSRRSGSISAMRRS